MGYGPDRRMDGLNGFREWETHWMISTVDPTVSSVSTSCSTVDSTAGAGSHR